MPVHLTILGSGSSGNCAYLETDGARILIDAGFSLGQIRTRLQTIGRVPENLDAVIVTHEHSDHVAGLPLLGTKLNIPIYCNRPTKEAVEYQSKKSLPCRLFTTGGSFTVGDVEIQSFPISHDAQDPVGYILRTSAGTVGFLTDLGIATKLVLERARLANVLVLETNYDLKMLQDCPHRPWSLKQRIQSRTGHLSNEDAANVTQEIMSADLRHVYLGHLSQQCNHPELAHRVIRDRLAVLGATHVRTEVTSQALPCPTLTL
ncbi:MAG: MBL fold metallo-hydrolase [Verrucomicrobia bacterium]|nr:MBL fold metallo-hydrolase [Verrucomicrobiota bacterium]